MPAPAPEGDDYVPAANWLPSANWENLRLRAELLRRVRTFFDERQFLEVETPLLSADVVVDRHLDPLSVTLPFDVRLPERGRRLWLQTSPEFGMKRLLASGGPPAIYQITRAFRAGETGRLHNPEFTIVEWYRRGDSPAAAMQLLSDLADAALGLGEAERVTYAEAFRRHVGIDPHRSDAAELRQHAERLSEAGSAASGGLSAPPTGLDRDGWLNWLLSELVEPRLGFERPTILCDYPASQAALAQVRAGDPTGAGEPPVAERFELYVRGIELANGYHELLDPAVLRARIAVANAERRRDGKPALPDESRLLAAMDHGLPQCCGVALGFDRLVMLAAGAESLADVLAFPVARA
jgi:lysyl-tRNA synthetase class 2